jgi:hypothetical protein
MPRALTDPHEKEILFGPLTGLEVRGTRVEGYNLVVSTNPSINLNASTMERVVARNLRALVDISRNMQYEIVRAPDRSRACSIMLQKVSRSISFSQREKMRGTGFGDAASDWLESRVDPSVSGSPLSHEPDWYNNDDNFVAAVKEVMEAKRSVLAIDRNKGGSLVALLKWIEQSPEALTNHNTCHALARLLEGEYTPQREAEFRLSVALLEKTPRSNTSVWDGAKRKGHVEISIAVGKQKLELYPKLINGGTDAKMEALNALGKLPSEERVRHAPRLLKLMRNDAAAVIRERVLELHKRDGELFQANAVSFQLSTLSVSLSL